MAYANEESIYEGDQPYLFISYSHKDHREMDSVKRLLNAQKIRYWYDNGLHSGDDWNLILASHLQKAALCLLLLSENSAGSDYVKNELNFAQNHRIPLHILLTHQFEVPIDIEMMTARIQIVEMSGDYQSELIRSLPGEVFDHGDDVTALREIQHSHSLFEVGELRSDRQGTIVYDGMHKRLRYPCAVVEDILQKEQISETQESIADICTINHPLFPVIYDIDFEGQKMLSYQEYFGGQFLDEYLSERALNEDTILRWTKTLVEGIDYLFKNRFAFRDFARGSMIVDNDHRLRFFRLHNPFYGVVRIREETKQFYFEKNLQEIAILLIRLCIGKEPTLPIRILEMERYDHEFLTRINVIIQKCTKENGKVPYHSFEEIIQDLERDRIRMQDMLFLQKRKNRLKEYDSARRKAREAEQFLSKDAIPPKAVRTAAAPTIEEKFGFEGTIALPNQDDSEQQKIHILICSTGIIYHFSKDDILVGRDYSCDLVWNQPVISRMHLKIGYQDANTYTVTDLNASNRSYVSEIDRGLERGEKIAVRKGCTIRIGSLEMQHL